MYKCNNCENRFEEPSRKRISFEDYYGVGNLFSNHHYTDMLVCPNCDDDDIEDDYKDLVILDENEIDEEI